MNKDVWTWMRTHVVRCEEILLLDYKKMLETPTKIKNTTASRMVEVSICYSEVRDFFPILLIVLFGKRKNLKPDVRQKM